MSDAMVKAVYESRTSRRFAVASLTCLALVYFAGCSQSGVSKDTVYPASGKVLVRGTPAEGARITFYPVAEGASRPGMAIPSGDVDSSGVYHLQSYLPGDGAPAGEYRVTVSWPEPLPPGANPEQVSRKDRLAGKYADPTKSKLTAKVEKGDGEIPPFELQ
jgi:hypothetical protein